MGAHSCSVARFCRDEVAAHRRGDRALCVRAGRAMLEEGPWRSRLAFTALFGCVHPLQQAGMGGFAPPDLAVAVSAAGGLGMLTGTVGAEALAGHLDRVPETLPFGVNFLVPFLDRDALEDAAARSSLVEFFWGEPDPGLVGQPMWRGSGRLAGRLRR